jgi:hypothetical protein
VGPSDLKVGSTLKEALLIGSERAVELAGIHSWQVAAESNGTPDHRYRDELASSRGAALARQSPSRPSPDDERIR